MSWLTGKQHAICEAQQLGFGGHQCFVTISEYLRHTCWVQISITQPCLPSLFTSPTNSKVGGLTRSTEGQVPVYGAKPCPGREQSSESTNPTHRQGSAPGSHTGQFRREQTQEGFCAHPKDQKGKLKKQMQGSHRLALKPHACCLVTLGRPCFFSGPQFSSL